MSDYNIIENNRLITIENFESLFEILGDKAWHIVLGSSNKDRTKRHEYFMKANDEVAKEVHRMINDLFDLHQIVESMPEDVRDAIYKKWAEMRYERKYGKTEE